MGDFALIGQVGIVDASAIEGCLKQRDCVVNLSDRSARSILADQALYVMQNQFGLIKVGRSLDPEARRRALELTESCRIELIHVVSNAGYREEDMHLLFHEFRLAGEWFDGTDRACEMVGLELSPGRQLTWRFALDRIGAASWLEGFANRQSDAFAQREISRFHGQLRRMTEPSWVWDSLLWDLFWLMEVGTRPSGSVELDASGGTLHRSWIEGREFVVPSYTSDVQAAMTLLPGSEQGVVSSASPIEICKDAMDARRMHWRRRKGLKGALFKPVGARMGRLD